MIVRILEEGQYRIDDGTEKKLHEIDEKLAKALDKGDEASFAKELDSLISHVRTHGHKLGPTELEPSDRAVPAEGSTLEEVKALLASEQPKD